MNEEHKYIKDALSLLGIERLALAIHDQSFPSLVDEEIGRGSPYAHGGADFLKFVAELGFNCLQLGPQGKTSRANPSPYDGSLFSKNEASMALVPLCEENKLIDRGLVAKLVKESPSCSSPRSLSSYRYAHDAVQTALENAFDSFEAEAERHETLQREFEVWQEDNSFWLEPEELFETLSIEYGTDDWRRWSEGYQRLCEDPEFVTGDRAMFLRSKHEKDIARFRFGQFLVHRQHQQFREVATACGVKLFADVQIGFSTRDTWAYHPLFIDGYLLGAPPSRTNPDGQPWGYPLLDPHLYFENAGRELGPALQFVQKRIDKLLNDFDGLRIDHPHGIVCPWVYKSDEPDALKAVQTGARLFESPNVPAHPKLAGYAIARADQLDESLARFADGWVKTLDEQQVERYGAVIDLIEARMRSHSLDATDIVCEVLSSCPFPLNRVLKHKHLGRFRVTQKADPLNRNDVYRTDTASRPDWVMLSTHDTPPIWSAAADWSTARREAWAMYLAQRHAHDSETRAQLTRRLATDVTALIEALFVDLFVGPAANVSIFFTDLLGMPQCYNRPGVVSEDNWVLSVPNDYRRFYANRIKDKQALSLPAVLAAALRSTAGQNDGTLLRLAEKLEKTANSPAQH